jgi:outer membrane lipoprotein-sorting protein
MTKTILLVCLFFVCMDSRAQFQGYTLLDNPESFKKAFARSTAATESIQSDFIQEKSLIMLSEKINASGKFWFQKKDKLRMEYIQPYTYLMILHDGNIYTREGRKENKISAGSNRVFQQVNRILIDCVSGSMLDNPAFQSSVFEGNGTYLIELKPRVKNLQELYKNINIVIDKKDYTATVIEMYEVSGDNTKIRFQNKLLNAHIPDSVFNIP